MPRGIPNKKKVIETPKVVTEEPTSSPIMIMESPIATKRSAKIFDELMQISRETEGWLTEGESKLLYEAAEQSWSPDCVWVEGGSYCGKSSVLLGGVLASFEGGRLYAVDPHEGNLSYPSHYVNGLLASDHLDNVGSTLYKCRDTLIKGEVNGFVSIVPYKLTDYTPPAPVDLFFLDALHDYESVKADWQWFKQFLVDQAVVIFHDYGQWDGVTRTVKEAVEAGELEECSTADSLIVLRYNKP